MLNIILLGITSLLTDISSEMVYPLIPLYLVNRLGATPAVLGLIEGIAESLASLLKVFSGYFSDRFKKRKPLTILGYSSSVLGKVFLYISASWSCVLLARIVDRFGKGIRTAPRDALIADSAHEKKRGRAFGLHRAMDTLGACIGITLAYIIFSLKREDFSNVFLWAIAPAVLGAVFLIFVKEKQSKQEMKPKERLQFKWSGLDRRLKFFLIFSFIFTLGNSSNQFLLLRVKNQGSSFAQVILFYLAYNIIYFLASYPAAWLSDKIGRKKILVLGYLFYGLVYIGFAVNSSFGIFWLLFGVYGLYMGFTDGVEKALVTDISPLNLRATTIGLHAALVGIGLLPASLLAGALWKFFGASAPFYFGGIMGLIASIGFWFVLRGL